jgi:putative peptidoglycan binding protein
MTYVLTLGIVLAGWAELHGQTANPSRRASQPDTYLRLQVLLDRAHFSPGELDGVSGENTRKALRAFRAAHGLREVGDLDPKTLRMLEGKESVPTLVPYTVKEDDVRGPFVMIPKDLMEQAKLPALDYQSPLEALGEKFHTNPTLLSRLNENQDFSRAGVEIQGAQRQRRRSAEGSQDHSLQIQALAGSVEFRRTCDCRISNNQREPTRPSANRKLEGDTHHTQSRVLLQSGSLLECVRSRLEGDDPARTQQPGWCGMDWTVQRTLWHSRHARAVVSGTR